MEEHFNKIMPPTFTEADRERLKNLVPDMRYYIENKLNFALRIKLSETNIETFAITTSAHPEDRLIYNTLIDEPADLNFKDGGFF